MPKTVKPQIEQNEKPSNEPAKRLVSTVFLGLSDWT